MFLAILIKCSTCVVFNNLGFFSTQIHPFDSVTFILPYDSSAYIMSSQTMNNILNITINNRSSDTIAQKLRKINSLTTLKLTTNITIDFGNCSTIVQIWILNNNVCPGSSIVTTSPKLSYLDVEYNTPSEMCIFYPSTSFPSQYALSTDLSLPEIVAVFDVNDVNNPMFVCPQGTTCNLITEVPIFISLVNFIGNELQFGKISSNIENAFNNCLVTSFFVVSENSVDYTSPINIDIDYKCPKTFAVNLWQSLKGLWIIIIILAAIAVIVAIIIIVQVIIESRKEDHIKDSDHIQTEPVTSPYNTELTAELNP